MGKLSYQIDYKAEKEKTIADLADKMNLKIKLPCNGKGKCGKCLIVIHSGDVNDPTKEEQKLLKEKQLNAGVRLACCCIPKGDVVFGPYED